MFSLLRKTSHIPPLTCTLQCSSVKVISKKELRRFFNKTKTAIYKEATFFRPQVILHVEDGLADSCASARLVVSKAGWLSR